MISKAIETALKAHEGEPRKGTEIPYVTHPLAVGIILAKAGCTDEAVTAGILHDTVENTHISLDDVRVKFGAKVAAIVQGCSEPDRGATWEERKLHTIEYLKRAPLDIKFVALADKLHNISSMASDYAEVGEELWDRFNASEENQRWYYEGLVVALHDDNADKAYVALHTDFATTVEQVFGAPEPKEEKLSAKPFVLMPKPSGKPISKRQTPAQKRRLESIKRLSSTGRSRRRGDPRNVSPVWLKRAIRQQKELGN